LPGHVFGDDFVAFQLSLFAEDFPPAEPHLQECIVLPLPLDFDRFDRSIRARLPQQFGSSAGISNHVSRKISPQEFLS
jgi:hypothetical protein